MRRLGSVLGLPVVLAGKLLGCVEGAELTADGKRLMGLTVRRGLGFARFLPAEDVEVLGSVAVIAARRPGRRGKQAGFQPEAVRDASGLPLGHVTDVWLGADLRVAALEVSTGPGALWRGERWCVRDFHIGHDPLEPGLVLTGCGFMLEAVPESEVRV